MTITSMRRGLLTILLLGTALPVYSNCQSCVVRSASHRDDLSQVGYYEDSRYFNSNLRDADGRQRDDARNDERATSGPANSMSDARDVNSEAAGRRSMRKGKPRRNAKNCVSATKAAAAAEVEAAAPDRAEDTAPHAKKYKSSLNLPASTSKTDLEMEPTGADEDLPIDTDEASDVELRA